jgi:diguanylate cyclase (GGDEF)-like protein/PAS domain S-box-containing protein
MPLTDFTPPASPDEELRRSEERFAAIFRASPVAIIIRSLVDGRFLDANDRFLEMTGYAREEVIGRTPSEVGVWVGSSVDDPNHVAGLVRSHGTVRNHEGTFRTKSGDLRHVLLSLERIELEGQVCLLGFGYDVTERKAAEVALRTSEERFRALVQNVNDIITILDADGVISYESPAVERVLGYTPEELIGVDPFTLIHPDDVAEVRDLFEEALRRPGVNIPAEFRFKDKSGSWRRLEVTGTNLLGDPSVAGIVVNSRDVTERKEAAEALRASEQRARELAAAAGRQAQELELLDQVRSALTRELELSDLFRTVVEAVAATFGYSLVSLYLIEGDVLCLQHQVGYHKVLDVIPLGRGVMGRVARIGEPVLLEDGQADQEFMAAFEGISSEVCVPLRDDGRVVGVLNLETTGGVRLREADLRLMMALSEHINVAIGRARLYAELRASEARFRSLVQHAADVVSVLDAESRYRYVSPAVERVLGYTPEELIGNEVVALLHPDDVRRFRGILADLAETQRAQSVVDFRARHQDGSWRWLEATITNLLADPSVSGIVVNSRDVTERKEAEARLVHQAFHDPLTGLPNRARFVELLEAALRRSGWNGRSVGVLLLDLDGFKIVNDSLGHEAGDQQLVAIAQQLVSCVGPGTTVARFGGDEFTVLLEEADAAEATATADCILAAMAEPVRLAEHEVASGASVGVALGPDHGVTPGELLRAADVALYCAKGAGRGVVVVYEPRMATESLARFELELDLRSALEAGELGLAYQPVVDLATGRVVAVEALARWDHPQRGLVLPDAFVPLAEETGLIAPIGAWVLEEACREAARWTDAATTDAPVVSVNVGARQLRRPRFAEEVARALTTAGLPPERLQLEVSEQVLVEELRTTSGTLRGLTALGLELAIDDFGSGASSLGYFRELKAHALKVDRSFVYRLAADPGERAIVRAIIDVAHAYGMHVTVEGVETAEQAHIVAELGCDRAQGFWFARPATAERVRAWIAGPSPQRLEQRSPAWASLAIPLTEMQDGTNWS